VPFGEQPAYLRVADDLRQQIADGSLPPHTRLPSQASIRSRYGVSDTVALEARKVLMAEGLVEGRSGSGTYVRQPPEPERLFRSGYRTLGECSPFRQEQADERVRGTWTARSERVEATAAVAARLSVEAQEAVMRTRYEFRVGDRTMMLSTSWEPLRLTGRTPVMLPEEGPLAGRGVDTADNPSYIARAVHGGALRHSCTSGRGMDGLDCYCCAFISATRALASSNERTPSRARSASVTAVVSISYRRQGASMLSFTY
jgi:DNA-binding transcriptional regulator YhcF (GntR family)